WKRSRGEYSDPPRAVAIRCSLLRSPPSGISFESLIDRHDRRVPELPTRGLDRQRLGIREQPDPIGSQSGLALAAAQCCVPFADTGECQSNCSGHRDKSDTQVERRDEPAKEVPYLNGFTVGYIERLTCDLSLELECVRDRGNYVVDVRDVSPRPATAG